MTITLDGKAIEEQSPHGGKKKPARLAFAGVDEMIFLRLTAGKPNCSCGG
jgi:hypothetical protein